MVKDFRKIDIQTYAYIRLIANLDECLIDNWYEKEDYLLYQKQLIEKAGKEKLLSIIKRINWSQTILSFFQSIIDTRIKLALGSCYTALLRCPHFWIQQS